MDRISDGTFFQGGTGNDMNSQSESDLQYEIVIGLVGAAGTDFTAIIEAINTNLDRYGADAQEIRVSKDVIPHIIEVGEFDNSDECIRLNTMMDYGNKARKKSGDNGILALGAAAKIQSERPNQDSKRRAYIVNSLKRPEEVEALREIYGHSFHLIAAFSKREARTANISSSKSKSKSIDNLLDRDQDEHTTDGQRTRATFHLADFFLNTDTKGGEQVREIGRFLDVTFGDHRRTPTFDEYAMYMAFASGLRSGDLSRQIGAVVARNNEILSTGANDCPAYGGGLYWPFRDGTGEICDVPNGRDMARGYDSNADQKNKLIQDILNSLKNHLKEEEIDAAREAIKNSQLGDITEYGRVVHAEMEALLSCSRNGLSCRGATLYTTTFPCHNCAKHIVAAGINRVVYVEPYPKSKALEFHDDSIVHGFRRYTPDEKVCFESFMGVGPRQFFDLFSMNLGSGYPLKRKDTAGKVRDWDPHKAIPRLYLGSSSILDREEDAAVQFASLAEGGWIWPKPSGLTLRVHISFSR